ncbi:hypothetical protein BKA69DRAFT_1125417 [Paraphysoderma sedebokerense]|nr:hypothetical protein BKA69DRAFT_1125417 [Paraphysoderma sedebokerense]
MPLKFTSPTQIESFWLQQQTLCPKTDIFSDNLQMIYPYKGTKIGCWVNVDDEGKNVCKVVKDFEGLAGGMGWLNDVCLLKSWHGKRNTYPIYNYLKPPTITWLDPRTLVPHEPVSTPHLNHLIEYLKSLDPSTLLPTIIVTKSSPPVILDGHHRWQASLHLKLPRVPVWIVDDTVADEDDFVLPVPKSQYKNMTELLESRVHDQGIIFKEVYEYFKVKVYDTRNYGLLRIREIADTAREAYQSRLRGKQSSDNPAGWGVKGTKHVAVKLSRSFFRARNQYDSYFFVDHDNENDRFRLDGVTESVVENEVRLERVAPRLEWGLWKAGGVETVKREDIGDGNEKVIPKVLVNSRSDSVKVIERPGEVSQV